ncbi:MAG: DUF4403 family protein [Hymenobacteraceae bacterium]|nr:DUF4403 family protein [Hymenobacteraceae bacterium]MDX5395556.1 DUF4403 family protein [Hymenobacteraceae bacterium]MDX5443982.1 DUF4403 family protein [Hymenobacteraceae bacterium]MDX5511610.1 DUF4403 family protein [Hymenobacteraceae bacterium]
MKKLLRQNAVALLIGISTASSLPACKSTTKLNTQAPEAQSVPAPAYVRKLSSVTVPVSFPVNVLEQKLNQQFSGVLYKDDKLDGDNVAITVTKNNNIGIKAENNKIYFTLPLNVYVKGRFQWKACDMCPTIEKTEDTRFDLVLKSESAISLTDDYKVKTTTVGDFEWGNTKPVIELGPLKIGLARFVEPAMRSQMGEMTKMLDAEIQKRVDIKQYVKDAWVQVQQPIELDKTLDAWLLITPQEIRASSLQAKNGMISMKIGLSSYIETVTNGKPQVKVNQNLPKLIIDNRMKEDVQIGLAGEISYEHASKLLQEQVKGQEYKFNSGKDQIKVNDASISGNGDKLVLMLDVDGKTKAGIITKKIKGKVYLQALPYYDAETQSIKVRDVDFTLDTKDKLLSTAGWIAKGKFKDMIQQQINFPVKAQLDEARKMVQTTLDQQGRVHESVLLTGKVTEITPDNIYLTPKSIKAVVNARGVLQVKVDKL